MVDLGHRGHLGLKITMSTRHDSYIWRQQMLHICYFKTYENVFMEIRRNKSEVYEKPLITKYIT